MSLLVFESLSAGKMNKCLFRHRGFLIFVRVPVSSDQLGLSLHSDLSHCRSGSTSVAQGDVFLMLQRHSKSQRPVRSREMSLATSLFSDSFI